MAVLRILSFYQEKWGFRTAPRNLAIRFRTQVRADRLHPELVAVLAEAGWFATSIGIENGSPTALKRMKKSATLQDNVNALAMLQQHRVYVQMGMILFDQVTTMTELRENHSFLSSLNWPVTKGIFTEMYAAEGTPFSELLSAQGRVLDSNFGNRQYRREHPRVEEVYRALRAWHQSHCQIYDHAINPISAPKAIPSAGYDEYRGLCIRLHRWDVEFFGDVLDLVERSTGAIDDFVADRIRVSVPMYNRVLESLLTLDVKYGLSYTAQPNKFL
ncbi:MAG: hypothetical protein HY978_02360 [Candidatus Liptonbacteria bacterium]|nr:hypothetical protein [Candidatus Liptonbacteria bacterium]